MQQEAQRKVFCCASAHVTAHFGLSQLNRVYLYAAFWSIWLGDRSGWPPLATFSSTASSRCGADALAFALELQT